MPLCRRVRFTGLSMNSVIACPVGLQTGRLVLLVAMLFVAIALTAQAAPGAEVPKNPADVKNAAAKTADEMKPYTDVIANGEITFDMVPIPGGKFMMGSPAAEADRKEDEGPQHEVEIEPFWMGKCEVTWNEYEIWMFNLDIQRRELNKVAADGHRKAGRRRDPADQALYRHDLRHGQGGLSGDLHDPTGRQEVLPVAQRQDGTLLPAADRGRMGICLPRRHHDGLFVRRRPGEAGRIRLVYRQQRRQVPQGRQEEAESLGPVRHARQRGRMDARPVRS